MADCQGETTPSGEESMGNSTNKEASKKDGLSSSGDILLSGKALFGEAKEPALLLSTGQSAVVGAEIMMEDVVVREEEESLNSITWESVGDVPPPTLSDEVTQPSSSSVDDDVSAVDVTTPSDCKEGANNESNDAANDEDATDDSDYSIREEGKKEQVNSNGSKNDNDEAASDVAAVSMVASESNKSNNQVRKEKEYIKDDAEPTTTSTNNQDLKIKEEEAIAVTLDLEEELLEAANLLLEGNNNSINASERSFLLDAEGGGKLETTTLDYLAAMGVNIATLNSESKWDISDDDDGTDEKDAVAKGPVGSTPFADANNHPSYDVNHSKYASGVDDAVFANKHKTSNTQSIKTESIETTLPNALEDNNNNLDDKNMSERDVDLLRTKCEQYEETIQALQRQNEELQSDFEASVTQGRSLGMEVLHLDSVLREVTHESQLESQELISMIGHQTALNEQNSKLEATIELLVQDYRNARSTEQLVDAEDASEILATEVLHLDSVLKDVNRKSQRKSQELIRMANQQTALNEQESKLEATIDLLVEDLRNMTEKFVDAEDARELTVEHQMAINEQNSELEATIDLLVEDFRSATEKLVDAEDAVVANTTLVGSDIVGGHSPRRMVVDTDCPRGMIVGTVNQYIYELEGEKRLLEKEVKKAAEHQKTCNEQNSKLEATIDLLVEDLRNVTEKRFDVEDALVNASLPLVENDELLVNKHGSQLEEKKELLEKEVKKMNKERFQAMDRANYREQQHKAAVDKLNEKLKASNQHVAMLQKSMNEAATYNAANIYDLVTEMTELSKEMENAMSSVADLTARCDKLSEDLECSMAKNVELGSARVKSEESDRKLAIDFETMGAEKTNLEEQWIKLVQSQRHSEANVKRLSEEVVFTHEEITRLTTEKEAIMEESESQLQKVNDRLKELEEENQRKSEQFQELWITSNASLLEKESAMETVKQLQHEKETSITGPLKEQDELSERIEELQSENEQQMQQIDTLIEAEGILQRMTTLLETENESTMATLKQLQHDKEQSIMGHLKEEEELSAKVDELQNENEQQKTQIETLIEAECILREINTLLETEKEVALSLMKKELGMEIEYLRQENTDIQDEKDMMQSEEEDLTWKINALTQNMSLRLAEKDAVISRLVKQIQGQLNETTMLKNEIHKRDAEKSSIEWKLNALPDLKATIEEQQIELKQKDVMVSNLRMEETRYKSEILRMQSKVDRMETWLHESLSFATPPPSPVKTFSNPQSSSTKRRSNPVGPLKGSSNPQSPQKSPSKRYGSSA